MTDYSTVTEFLPQHPGGTMIVQASAGLDASKTFDDLAHTSNPEVMSLLSKYFLGHLATKPDFRSTGISNIYDLWHVMTFVLLLPNIH
jgi:cytochrome b involved in lipid metabolism